MNRHRWHCILRIVSLTLGIAALAVLFASGAAHATSTDAIQWSTDVTMSFSPDELAQPDWQANAQTLVTGLDARLSARDASLQSRRTNRPDRGADYQFTMSGRGGLAQFKSVMFDDARPIGGFLGGPATLKLTGDVAANENLDLLIESNPSTGYTWDVQGMDGTLLELRSKSEVHSEAQGLGVPMHQVLYLRGKAAGRTTLTLTYHRQWESELPTRVMTLDAPQLNMLTDLSNPAQVDIVQPAADHAPLTTLAVAPAAAASYFDWRDQGKLTPVRDQKNCGSCWAFSTVGAFEADLLIQNGISSNLSEQYLISCNSDGWSCDGGWFAHDYHVYKPGIYQQAAGSVDEAAFPYLALNAACPKAFTHTYKLSSWHYVGAIDGVPSVDAIKNAIATYGPVSVAVCAGSGWNTYYGGVFRTEENNQCNGGVNHAVVLTGWDDSVGAWILRNSWGSGWGESGYMRIGYGVSNVGYGANYVVGSSNPNVCYSLTTKVNSAGAGNVTVNPGPNCNSTQYTAGTKVTLTANPGSAYQFGSWTGSAYSTVNPLTLTMTANQNITANMRLKNMLWNPNMENDTDGDNHPDKWSPLANFTRTSATYQSGHYSGQLRATDNGTYRVVQSVAGITGGRAFQVSGWFNIPSTTDAFAFYYNVRWLNSTGGIIRVDPIKSYTAATGGWVQGARTVTAPATASSAQVVLAALNLNATIYVDNLYFGP